MSLTMQEIVSDRLRNAHGDLSHARNALDSVYGLLDGQARADAWIAGEDFGMADCAAAPALFYASTLQPFPPGCDALVAYFDRLMDRPSVRRVIAEAQPYFPMYPFMDAIPPRFLDDGAR